MHVEGFRSALTGGKGAVVANTAAQGGDELTKADVIAVRVDRIGGEEITIQPLSSGRDVVFRSRWALGCGVGDDSRKGLAGEAGSAGEADAGELQIGVGEADREASIECVGVAGWIGGLNRKGVEPVAVGAEGAGGRRGRFGVEAPEAHAIGQHLVGRATDADLHRKAGLGAAADQGPVGLGGGRG